MGLVELGRSFDGLLIEELLSEVDLLDEFLSELVRCDESVTVCLAKGYIIDLARNVLTVVNARSGDWLLNLRVLELLCAIVIGLFCVLLDIEVNPVLILEG